MTTITDEKRFPIAWRAIGVLCAVKFCLYLLLHGRYGFHGDELYFIECGKHLAFGYVDHAPLVPWIARISGELFGYNLASIRLFPMLASLLTITLSSIAAREFGGQVFAQCVAGLCALIAPAFLVMGGMLDIPVFEPVYWMLAGLVIIRLLRGGDPRWWILVGFVAGVGLLNKHTMLLWGTGLAVGFLLTPHRQQLKSPWPWCGGVIALLLFLPNIVWQMGHDWATWEFIQNMDSGQLAEIPRVLFLAGQVLYMHPFTLPIWGLGLLYFFSKSGKRYRVFGWIYVSTLTILLIRQGKPYYLAPAYPMLFAGGAVYLEAWSANFSKPLFRRLVVAGLAVGGIALAPPALPILPLPQTETYIEYIVGDVVPARELTNDFHLQHGWPDFVDVFAETYGALSEEEKLRTAIITQRYSLGSAVNFYGPQYGLPRAYCGQMNYYFWGPPPETATIFLITGYDEAFLQERFEEVQVVAELTDPLAGSRYRGLPIYRCNKARFPLNDIWSDFRSFYHDFTEERRQAIPSRKVSNGGS